MCSLTVGSVTFHECLFLVRKLPLATLAGSILWLLLGTFHLTFIYKKMSSFRWQLFSLQYWQIFPGRALLRSTLSASQDASYVSFHPRFLRLFFIRLWQFRCETSWWKLGWIILDCRASSWVFLSSRLKNFSIIYLNKICIHPNSHHSRMSIYIGHWFSWWQDWGSWCSVEDVLDLLFRQQADVSPHAGMLRVMREVI